MLLRDVFTIPEKVDSSDFVLQLEPGVAAAERTLGDYVVTDALATAIDDALGLVQRTVEAGTSKGAFVHGSFGSGKSHFMAVLHLLLTGNTTARAMPGLQHVVAQREAVLNTRLLAVDYHLLGAESFESALFEGYQRAITRLHPDAEPPVLHQSGGLLADAAGLRAEVGDERFFAGLNESSGVSSGWGARNEAWGAATYEAAAQAPVGDARRAKLVNALVTKYFASYRRSGEWLDIETGLRAMTQHAADLGYDGVVLFLDELVLWLAQHLSDTHFIQNETSKVARLVETGMSSLPVPLVSFVARQRDLKDFLGGDAVGAEQAAIGQSFTWWEERFERIELAAADLPQIVQRRLLTPVSPEAKQALADAVARVRSDSAAWGYLLTDENRSGGTEFELTYPFSPALVDAMIALSALMQRERTALRIMGELLSAGRDELRVTDVIPVGDLFDVVVRGGRDPLTAEMKQHFANARVFYEHRMRPYLLAKHGLTEDSARTLPRDHPFRTEDRLATTLLVAFLAPGAPSLRNLTYAKLAALNYGTIQTFVPGQQAQRVMALVKEWAAEFIEVHIGEGADPVVSLSLTGVNYDLLLESVQHEDTEANRRKLIREMLTDELGITAQGGLLAERTLSVVWRGSRREVDVVFGNVRDASELPDEVLKAPTGRWKVVIDFPFDAGDHTPQEDLNRLARLRESGWESATLVWLPYFLTPARMAEIGKLYQLDYLLTGERFEQSARQLNPGDREPARIALDNNRRSLRAKVLDVLRQAYGVVAPVAENVDAQIHASEVFTTLLPSVSIQPSVVASLRAALESALRQGLDAQHPDHPTFDSVDTEVKRGDLTTVLELARRAIEAGGRLDQIERAKAAVLRRVAVPLRVGEARESVYALSAESFGWLSDFTRWAVDTGVDGEVRIGDLRARLQPYGMVNDVEDLLVLVWSALEDREWVRGGTRVTAPSVGAVTGDMVLRPARLPDQTEWAQATRAAAALFGAAAQPRRSAAGAARLAAEVRAAVSRLREPATRLVDELERHARVLRLDTTATGRLATARRGASLLDALGRENDDTVLLQVLARADVPQEPQALAKSMSSAADVRAGLAGTDWDLIGSARRLPDGVGDAILTDLAAVAAQEELHAPLAPALRAASKAVREALLDRTPGVVTPLSSDVPPVNPAPVNPPPVEPVAAPVTVDEITLDVDRDNPQLGELTARIAESVRAHPGKRLRVTWWFE
ncbi:DUF6079 family protein [Cellulomonas fimi]|uniref:Phage resistance protein n=1 Tax=Cellulomonas fimi TaxID=1708 RepID=A0A7Y0LZG5_CELFI|nr:DUF6079 family protein [Cellulomonas fimi]NMR20263.1 hypothetical protein [Cellulomonas fimi]